MEHHHGCLYCRTVWFCHDDCPVLGPSVCEECREKLRRSPDTPRRLVGLRRGSRTLDRLTEHTAEQLRERLRRDRPL